MFKTRADRARRFGALISGALSLGALTLSLGAAQALGAHAPAGGRHGGAVLGSCQGVRLAPRSACVTPYAVSASEDWLIAAEDEASGGTLCVYLSDQAGRAYRRAPSPAPASCNGEPAILSGGFTGHPTVYNATRRWATVVLAIFH